MKKLVSHKIRLRPTSEQKAAFSRHAGVARWAYNRTLSRYNEDYQSFKEGKADKKPNLNDLKKEITQLKKTEEFSWLSVTDAFVTNGDSGYKVPDYIVYASSFTFTSVESTKPVKTIFQCFGDILVKIDENREEILEVFKISNIHESKIYTSLEEIK